MFWFVVGVIVLLIIAKLVDKKGEERKHEIYEETGNTYIESANDLKYLSGFKDIGKVSSMQINDFLREGILCKVESSGVKKEKLIKWNEITDISLQTESYIKEQVKLSNLIIFGMFAFGMEKKQKRVEDDFIVITIKNMDSQHSLIFTSNTSNQKMYDKLVNYKWKYS